MVEFRAEPEAIIIGKSAEQVQKDQLELLRDNKARITRVVGILKGGAFGCTIILYI
jgi:hypothetical protein